MKQPSLQALPQIPWTCTSFSVRSACLDSSSDVSRRSLDEGGSLGEGGNRTLPPLSTGLSRLCLIFASEEGVEFAQRCAHRGIAEMPLFDLDEVRPLPFFLKFP